MLFILSSLEIKVNLESLEFVYQNVVARKAEVGEGREEDLVTMESQDQEDHQVSWVRLVCLDSLDDKDHQEDRE